MCRRRPGHGHDRRAAVIALLSPEELSQRVGAVPDFPIPGIVFRDITTLLADPESFRSTVAHLGAIVAPMVNNELSGNTTEDLPVKLAAIESRGFIFGAAVGHELGLPIVLIRKPGKLPRRSRSISYELEYGSDQLEVHVDDVGPRDHVIVVDDLLATGGTAVASVQLLRDCGATVDHAVFVVDLPDLDGAGALAAANVASHAVLSFAGH